MTPYLVTERWEYDLIVDRGFEPLIDINNFQMEISLRIAIQKEIFGHCIFGRGDVMQANERFFRWVWVHKPHVCEETMQPLRNYSAVHCSHILTRGAHPEMAHDPRNINLLTFEMHERWENGDRQNMRIYARNMRIVELLKQEYMNA